MQEAAWTWAHRRHTTDRQVQATLAGCMFPTRGFFQPCTAAATGTVAAAAPAAATGNSAAAALAVAKVHRTTGARLLVPRLPCETNWLSGWAFGSEEHTISPQPIGHRAWLRDLAKAKTRPDSWKAGRRALHHRQEASRPNGLQ